MSLFDSYQGASPSPSPAPSPTPGPSTSTSSGGASFGAPPTRMDAIDYEIKGSEMQFVEIELDPGEAAIGEAGSLMFMEGGIDMDTVFGDGAKDGAGGGGGFMGKLLGAGKRLITGESLFTTVYTNHGHTKQRVAFASPYPGKILPMDLRQLGGMLICQKDAFLCAARGVSLGIHFQQKLSVGFFGGEGFIMQKLTGPGVAFVCLDGEIMEYTMEAGQVLKVDTGHVAMYEPTIDLDIEMMRGFKNVLFGGEGLFLTTLQGPGRVWLQTMPTMNLAKAIAPYMATGGSSGGGSGASILGSLLND